ncbi:MAG TPA: 3-deoxy-manno-octulosonate cytidylyltransferase [Myxococcota bacterium]|nr:3-deoxy-manno-octulosonate cytidylyltransferase [Myxococcota bacterium]
MGVHAQIVIPARFDSGRLPGKALLPLAGKPLLQHTWERAARARLGPLPIVATEDERIAEAARAFGAPVAMTSAGHRCGSERVAEVAASLPAEVELVLNVQGDEALLEPAQLQGLPAVFADPAVGMATLVARLEDPARWQDPSLVKAVLDERGDALYFSRAPIPYPGRGARGFWAHLGVYAFRRAVLEAVYAGRPPGELELAEGLEQLRALAAGVRIRALVVPAGEFGVNTPADLERARRLLSA